MSIKSIALAATMLALSSSLNAAVITYDNEAAYLTALGSYVTETFEGETDIGTPEGGAATSRTFDYFDVSSSPASIKVLAAPSSGNFNTTTGGSKYLAFDTNTADTSADVTFTFDSLINAVGFNYIDVEDVEGVAYPVVLSVNGTDYGFIATGNNQSEFLGIISDQAFNSFLLDAGNTDPFYSIDDLSFRVVPVPAAVWLFGSGLIGLIGVARRKKS